MTASTVQYDVVVIGGGLAGLTAAARAAQLGLKVLVLERGADERYPCNSRYSGGVLHLAFHNVTEPADDLLKVINEATHGYAKPYLARAFAGNCARAVGWLRDEGAKFIRVGNVAYQQHVLAPPRPLTPGLDWRGRGPDVTLRTLVANLEKRGGSVVRGTAVDALIIEARRVCGVEATRDGKSARYAARAVVIADGGFQANLEMLRENLTREPEKLMQRGAATGIGDGLRMARAAGAAISELKYFYGHLLSRDSFTNDRVWPYPQLDELGSAGILVNANGERFVDEGKGGVFCANAIAKLDDPLSTHAVFDQSIWDGPGRNARIPANPNLEKVGATLHKADSLTALARAIGASAEKLEHTVHAYNEALRSGRAGELNPPRSTKPITANLPIVAMPVAAPPFYAAPLCAGITYTLGGVAIDEHARVLREDGAPVAGLYAAGAATGGIEGGDDVGYVGGLIKAAVFGLLAAEHIASPAG